MTVEVPDEVIQAVAEYEKKLAEAEKANEKLRKENAERRIENREMRLARFDEDVRELIPEGLSPAEAEEHGNKLQALKGTAPQGETPAPQEGLQEQGAPKTEPHPLAPVSTPPVGNQPAPEKLTYAEWMNIYNTQGAEAAFAIPQEQVELADNPLPMHVRQ